MTANPESGADRVTGGVRAQPPLFSIIMPAYQARGTIASSIDSVVAQTERDWELIVCDDSSSDGTAELVESIAALDPRIRLLRASRNEGVAAARNRGLRKSRGQYVCFLDADDSWAPRKLEIQRRLLDTGERVVFGAYERLLVGGRRQIVRPPSIVKFGDFLWGNPIGNLTGVYWRGLGLVEQKRTGHEDHVMWADIVRRAGRAVSVPDVLGTYTVSSASVSSNKLRAASWHWRNLRREFRMSLPVAVFFFVGYAIRGVMRRALVGFGAPRG